MSYIKINQEMYAIIFKMLLREPQSIDSLQDATGLHRVTLYRLFRSLKSHKVVHVTDWEQDKMGRDAKAVYKLGAGRDKAKTKVSTMERTRRYRERQQRKKANEALDNIITKGLKNAQRTHSEACPA